MAMKKSTPPRVPGNPGGRTSQKISPSVTVLGPKLPGFTSLPNPPRASLKPKQMDEARALADRLKAREAKAAAEKKANAKIIKKQNKDKPLRPEKSGTKAEVRGKLSTKPVIKVTPPRGRSLRGGAGGMGGGGLFGGRGLGGTR
jgi:hypothetical protein